ncbi:hypothetical protein LTR53_010144 [Teratosphaeriaceae sp. CCFEE 6253]|nr:hypothetical protein LTR53_010144 [Teratosphaeriaceae sp. CCFEE 6253]
MDFHSPVLSMAVPPDAQCREVASQPMAAQAQTKHPELPPTSTSSPDLTRTSSRWPSTQLYSPTQAEIDSHPVVRHYSPIRDELPATLGSAPLTSPTRQPTHLHAMADKEIKEGDEVSWPWGGGAPGGTVGEVKEHGELTVKSKKGNEIKKKADPEDPAVKIVRSGNDVVKRAHELDVEEKGDGHKEEGEAAGDADADDADAKADAEEGAEVNGDAKAGEKRKADDGAEKADEEGEKPAAAKKAKKGGAPNGDKAEPKKKGRPAKKEANGAGKAKAEPKQKKEPKKAATESGQPRRSGRNSAK